MKIEQQKSVKGKKTKAEWFPGRKEGIELNIGNPINILKKVILSISVCTGVWVISALTLVPVKCGGAACGAKVKGKVEDKQTHLKIIFSLTINVHKEQSNFQCHHGPHSNVGFYFFRRIYGNQGKK